MPQRSGNMLIKTGRRGYNLRIVIGTIMLTFMLLAGSATAQAKTWHVLAGGNTPDMALQGMGFYPGNITINEGDTIRWTTQFIHTVSFLSGNPAPPPGSPASLSPAGGSTYNGTGFVSSGLILPGMSYSLTFIKAGIYRYDCLVHPGMTGNVIVQPVGRPYPFVQSQYDLQGKMELKADLEAGRQLVENLSLTSAPGPNGTTIWQASIDIPTPVDAQHKAAYMRFTPGILKIHAGDQVVWTQLDPIEIHTVTFLAAGQKAPDFILPMPGGFMINPGAAAPSGGSIYNGTGYASSGILAQGQNYTLTFPNPGVYSYLCLIHDEWGMIGQIIVMPPAGTIAGMKYNDSNGNRVKDPGETGLEGWTIRLSGFDRHTQEAVMRTNTTDANGNYVFTNLSPGAYVVSELNQPGWMPTTSPLVSITLGNDTGAVVDFGNRQTIQQRISGNYHQTNLVSDVPGLAQITDPNLVNSWGIAHPPTGPWWVADNGMGVSTLYNGSGIPFPLGSPLIVSIPPPPGGIGPSAPTGIVFNGGSDFNITPGNPARFIFVTEDGTISGWNPAVDPLNATLRVNNSPAAVYKGATIAQRGNASFLYVANFRGGSVDVFDTNFTQVILPHGAFVDKLIPSGFAPFNVQNINGKIFVTFAKQDAIKHDNLDGPGLGFVDVFDPDGNLEMRLIRGFWFNAPWGIALAPSDFGKFSNKLLIGNFGSGQIAAFDLGKGNFDGFLTGIDGKPITIDGLWGLGFGNGANAGPTNALFFAAGIDDEMHGLFGTITP